MEGSHLAPPVLARRPTCSVAGDSPVSPTGGAIAHLQPLGLREVVLEEGCELGDWQRRNSARTLPHCVEQVRTSGAVRNLERVAEGRGQNALHEGMHFSDSDVYKVVEAAAWDSVRGLCGGVQEFVEEVSVLIAPPARMAAIRGSRVNTLIWPGRTCVGATSFYCAGHLLQAAVAGRRTGCRPDLFTVSSRFFEHLLKETWLP